ncbi:MAG: hypothetical protein ACM359_00160 [Bacillota bacterium]
MYVTFIDMKGNRISGPIAMDRLPAVGEEVRLGDDLHVVQGTPVLNEPQMLPAGNRFVSVLTVAPKGKGKKKAESVLVKE